VFINNLPIDNIYLGVSPRKGSRVGLFVTSPRHSCLMAVGFSLQSLTQLYGKIGRLHFDIPASPAWGMRAKILLPVSCKRLQRVSPTALPLCVDTP